MLPDRNDLELFSPFQHHSSATTRTYSMWRYFLSICTLLLLPATLFLQTGVRYRSQRRMWKALMKEVALAPEEFKFVHPFRCTSGRSCWIPNFSHQTIIGNIVYQGGIYILMSVVFHSFPSLTYACAISNVLNHTAFTCCVFEYQTPSHRGKIYPLLCSDNFSLRRVPYGRITSLFISVVSGIEFIGRSARRSTEILWFR